MSSTISDGQMVFIQYVLRDEKGTEVDRSPDGEPLGYLHGHGQMIAGLEDALSGQKAGAVVKVQISPESGYGERNPEHVMIVPRRQFEFDAKVGEVVRAEAKGVPAHPFTIIEVNEDEVTLDGNHPLAGHTLDFEVNVISMRPATEEEVQEAAETEN